MLKILHRALILFLIAFNFFFVLFVGWYGHPLFYTYLILPLYGLIAMYKHEKGKQL